MGDEETGASPTYAYVGERAEGEIESITAGEAPKTLTKEVALLGERSGEGEASYPNGDKYKGGFAGGLRSGFGTFTYATQPPPEEGEDPKPPAGVYEGHWKAGERSGVGVMTFSSGAKYHGSWSAGKFEGQGTMFYHPSGDIYTGNWKAGRKHGMGTYICKESGARATGTWVAGKLVSGKFEDKFSNAYEGSFEQDGGQGVTYGTGACQLVSGASHAISQPLSNAVKSMLAMYNTPAGLAELRGLWDSLDKDGDGTVSKKEWGKGISKNWASISKYFDGCTKTEVGKMFNAIDVDGSNDLTWKEFTDAIEERIAAAS